MGEIIENRNIIENRKYTFECTQEAIEKYILENNINKEKCIRNGIPYFEIKENYKEEIQRAYKWIDTEINCKKHLSFAANV